jgi:hypothetical protein
VPALVESMGSGCIWIGAVSMHTNDWRTPAIRQAIDALLDTYLELCIILNHFDEESDSLAVPDESSTYRRRLQITWVPGMKVRAGAPQRPSPTMS